MRIVFFFCVATLLWSFWKAVVRLRGRHAALTPILGWIVGLGFFNLAPLTVMVCNGGYEFPSFYNPSNSWSKVDLSDVKYFIPFLVIWMSLLFSFLAIILLTPAIDEKRIRSEISFNESKLRRIVFITGCITLLDYVVTIWMAGGLQDFFASHWYERGEEFVARLGDLWTVYQWLSMGNLTVFTAGAALYTHAEVRRRRVDWRLSALILSILLLHVAMMGDRIFLALYLLSFLCSCWIYRRKKLMVALLLIAPVLALVFSAWGYFRNDLPNIGENIPTYMEGDLGNRAVTSLMDAFDGPGTMLLFHVINDFGDKYEYMYGASYARALFFMIPRHLFPQKPPTFANQMAIIYAPGETTSFDATELGELYANFGALSMLLLPFVTVLILHFSEKFTQEIEKHVLLSGMLFLVAIWFARTTFADNLLTLLFGWLLVRGLQLERGLCFPSRFRLASQFVSR